MVAWYIVLIAVAVTLAISIPVSALVATRRHEAQVQAKIGDADKKAREIIDGALKAADEHKREALLEAKEENIRLKDAIDQEIRQRRDEVTQSEKRVQQKEEVVDKRSEAIERKEEALASREQSISDRQKYCDSLESKRTAELERISGMTADQARETILSNAREQVKHEEAVMVREMETRARDEAARKAQEYVVTAIQRCSADEVAESTVSIVQLPSDDMKGRIIGREGRNIRAIEQATGVDLIIDDTPEAVVLSGYDPIRREVAKITLEKLIVDGRIHPARIEETVAKAEKEVESHFKEDGEAAMLEVGVHGIHPDLVRLLGKMKYRTSFGQNVLRHSVEVAQLTGMLASELGLDVRLAKRAGLLHDIGKSVDKDMDGTHVQIGADMLRKYKENPVVINAAESHHGDVEATSMIAALVQAADAISAARPGARRDTLEAYTGRLRQLEEITNSFEGVEQSYAIQAGREVRVIVRPDKVSDDDMVLLARDIAKRIEEETEYPGMVKVNLIRESRAAEYAK